MTKVTKKEKEKINFNNSDKFDKLMKDANEKESLPIDCSIHALSAMVVRQLQQTWPTIYGVNRS